MTLTSQTNRVTYLSTAGLAAYPIPFPFFTSADITLFFNKTWCSTGFTISGGNSSTGTLTFTSAPPASTELIIVRWLTLTQSVDLSDHDPLPAAALEQQGLDRLVMLIQQADELNDRTLSLEPFSCYTGLTVSDPDPGKVLMWNAAGTGLENTTNGTVGPTGPTGATGPAGAGAAPAVTDCTTTVTVPTSLWFDAASGFDVTEPGPGVAKITLTVTEVPTGTVIAYIAATEPTGWKSCNGQALNRTTYATLYAVIGDAFGAGDGVNTFNVPDLRGRSVVGLGTGGIGGYALTARSLAAYAGCETHTLLTTEMPAHTHTVPTGAPSAGNATGIPAGEQWVTPLTSSSTGGGGAHNNMAPFMVLAYLIKV